LARQLLSALPLARARRVLDAGCGVGTLLSEIQEAASHARVVGVDRAEGMVGLSPPDFPKAVMDVSNLAFEDGVFDAGIMAFVLFHLPAPVRGLKEMRRVLAPRGSLGVITWGRQRGYPALDEWDSELDVHGAEPIDARLARRDLVDTPEKVITLLEETGFDAMRTWTGQYVKRMTVAEFIAHRTSHGMSRRRFLSLDPGTRDLFMRRVRGRLRALNPEDFVARSEVIYAVATCNGVE
jgi:ubiquinone/menaquinone biosynthesis C-methylase UbiE